ncbi:CobW family GTP-binding protein [Rhodopila sp.]|jgi:G3E family GTPase|uniref:CobW family GTP-binding protein n=1 Tax=Rhodopila sp. TaxID=2480087 RepID=UPI002C0C76FC|nr:GTP-binding protein [Rhodopila sp.]HVZ08056.1 GTP-binding protein [Rhodopila sp.]
MSEVGAPVPVLLVAGFLGAGKTTVVNHLLAHADGKRIAAVVNDFGAINIDAALIAGAADGVVSLSNGCICCSLEGDLLRTLSGLLRRDPRPEAIVIETSGVADPREVARTLMDPVIWREAPLEMVLCVVDAMASEEALADPLLQAQLRAADVVALSRTDLADAAAVARVRAAVAAMVPRAVVVEAPLGAVPPALVFSPDMAAVAMAAVRDAGPRDVGPRDVGRLKRPVAERFETFGWTSERPVSLPAFQAAIGRLAPKLARAKGILEVAEQPGRRLVFHLAGGRATLAPYAGTVEAGVPAVRVVFVAELGRVSAEEVAGVMGDFK